MLGKIIEIHENDATKWREPYIVGSLWEISKLQTWVEEDNWGEVGYMYGDAECIECKASDHFDHFLAGDIMCFHAVKFEILENTGE